MMKLLQEYVQQVLLERLQPFNMEEFRRLSGEDAEEYLDFHARVLGSGIGRIVYDTGLGYVIKWAIHGEGGLLQNEQEAKVARSASDVPVPRVYVVGPKFQWLAVERVKPLKSSKAVKMALKKATNGLVGDVDKLQLTLLYSENYQIWHNPWLASLIGLIRDHDVSVWELHYDNWGIDKRGRLVLLDPGD